MEANRVNMSYFWKWDYLQGWNYTTFFSFFDDFGEDEDYRKYIEFGAIAVLSFCSFVVNILLIIFFLSKKDLRKDLHMYTISIMLSSVLLIPFALLLGITRLSPDGWMFGNIACKTTLYMITTTAFVKIWLMTLISVDRYLRVVHTHHRYMGRKLSTILIVLAWTLPAATLAGMVYPNSRAIDIDNLYGGISICTVSFKYNPEIRNALVYFSTIFMIEFFLPATIMTVCYALIMKKIKRSTKALTNHASSSQRTLNNTKAVDKSLRANIRRRRTTIILITIMVLFLLMWMPLFGLLAVITLDQILETFQLSARWVVAQVCVLLLNTLIEPFLYSFTTAKVRKELKNSLRSTNCFKTKTIAPVSSVDETSTQNYSTAS